MTELESVRYHHVDTHSGAQHCVSYTQILVAKTKYYQFGNKITPGLKKIVDFCEEKTQYLSISNFACIKFDAHATFVQYMY